MKPRDLFLQLNIEHIRYCHWKSNEHLSAGLEGDTDLDILVDPEDINKFRECLVAAGWIRVVSRPHLQGIEDWIFYSPDSDKMYHLHVHTFIPVGGTVNKIFSLHINQVALSNLVLVDDIYLIDPNVEKKLLMLRVCLKTSIRQIAAYYLKGRPLYPDNIQAEVDWLRCRSGSNASVLYSDKLDSALEKIWQSVLGSRLRPVTLIYYAVYLRLLIIKNFSVKRYVTSNRKAKKILPKRGLLVAVVGVDGSGKSSNIETVTEWLSWKLKVNFIYFGLPKKTFLERLVFIGMMKLSLNDIFHLFVAVQRYRKARDAMRRVGRGEIVVTDRYPLLELWTPKLSVDGPRVKGVLRSLELYIYSCIPRPDKIIYLQASIETLTARDATVPVNIRKEKYELINNLEEADRVVVIDANQQREFVVKDVKLTIWSELCKSSN